MSHFDVRRTRRELLVAIQNRGTRHTSRNLRAQNGNREHYQPGMANDPNGRPNAGYTGNVGGSVKQSGEEECCCPRLARPSAPPWISASSALLGVIITTVTGTDPPPEEA